MTKLTKILIVAFVLFVTFMVSVALYQAGKEAGRSEVTTTPIATQAQRIKELETIVEMLVNNEQISAETALKLDALEALVNEHIESHVDTTTEGTATP